METTSDLLLVVSVDVVPNTKILARVAKQPFITTHFCPQPTQNSEAAKAKVGLRVAKNFGHGPVQGAVTSFDGLDSALGEVRRVRVFRVAPSHVKAFSEAGALTFRARARLESSPQELRSVCLGRRILAGFRGLGGVLWARSMRGPRTLPRGIGAMSHTLTPLPNDIRARPASYGR
jgi:hypothetical protein